jgi:hypothetical protein
MEEKKVPWLITLAFVIGGGALGAFMSNVLWLRILLGVVSAAVVGFGGWMFASYLVNEKNRALAVLMFLFVAGGGVLGALSVKALWLRTLIGLAGALVLALIGCITSGLLEIGEKKERDVNNKLSQVFFLTFAIGGAALGALLGHALWQRALLGLAGYIVLGTAGLVTEFFLVDEFIFFMSCKIDDGDNFAYVKWVYRHRIIAWIVFILAVGLASTGVILGNLLWQRVLFGVVGYVAPIAIAAVLLSKKSGADSDQDGTSSNY